MYSNYIDKDTKIFIRINEVDITKPNLWFIHGFADSSTCFEEMSTDPITKEFNTYIIDLPGFGQSTYDANLHCLEKIHLVIIKLIEKFSHDKETYIIGHSIGATIAVLIAHELKNNVRYLINIDGLLLEDYQKESSLSHANNYTDCESFKNFMIKKLSCISIGDPFLPRYINNIKQTDAYILHEWSKASIKILKDNNIFDIFNNLNCTKKYLFGSNSINKTSSKITTENHILSEVELMELQNIGHWPMLENPKNLMMMIGPNLMEFLHNHQKYWPQSSFRQL